MCVRHLIIHDSWPLRACPARLARRSIARPSAFRIYDARTYLYQSKTAKQTQPSFICNSLPPGEHGLAKILAVFYLQKYFEYWDTYFFIMRRSFRQVRASFVCQLHIHQSTGSFQPFNPAIDPPTSIWKHGPRSSNR